MLSSEIRPFDLEPAQIVLRLTSSTLLATMNTMMLRGTGSQTVHPLTSAELTRSLATSRLLSHQRVPPPSTRGCAARSEVDFPDDAAAVTEYMQLESEVRISTATYADGQPATHARGASCGPVGTSTSPSRGRSGSNTWPRCAAPRRARCSLWTIAQRSLPRRRTLPLPPTNHPGPSSTTWSRPLASTGPSTVAYVCKCNL